MGEPRQPEWTAEVVQPLADLLADVMTTGSTLGPTGREVVLDQALRKVLPGIRNALKAPPREQVPRCVACGYHLDADGKCDWCDGPQPAEEASDE